MVSGEEIKNILTEVATEIGYQDPLYLYNLGYKNPLVSGERVVDLLEALEIYAKARTREMKIGMALSIEEVLSSWTRGFANATNADWLRNRRAVGRVGRE